ncbi:MAG TPA: hypothetical protein VI980_04770, partial [Acidimicrobiia bacterium]|nr:hypothetical protein [Acidimicrobiia bacterium]
RRVGWCGFGDDAANHSGGVGEGMRPLAWVYAASAALGAPLAIRMNEPAGLLGIRTGRSAGFDAAIGYGTGIFRTLTWGQDPVAKAVTLANVTLPIAILTPAVTVSGRLGARKTP